MKIKIYTFFILFSSTAMANPCLLPFTEMTDPLTKKPYEIESALNDHPGPDADYRGRYLVADLNTTDKSGICRGVQEKYANIQDIPELTSGDYAPETLKNFTLQVEKFRTKELTRPAIFEGYCIGQTLNLCELRAGVPVLIASFITSSSKWVPARSYYAPQNIIRTKRWSSDRKYTKDDEIRDERLGGGSSKILKFEKKWEMPNFMNFVPDQGQKGETQNGIHEIAGGRDTGGTFGAPVSLGCLRLRDYTSKFARWWTPMGAKFFIHFKQSQYHKLGNPKTRRGL